MRFAKQSKGKKNIAVLLGSGNVVDHHASGSICGRRWASS